MNGHAILADDKFWARMAYVTSASMSVSSDKELRRQWIDDLIPDEYQRSNAGLHVEGVAHLMGNKNGRFGQYRFSVSLPWELTRNRDRKPVIERIELDHSRKELFLVVVVQSENQPNKPVQRTGASARR